MKAIDEKYLRLAIEEAQIAAREGEVPVGSVITFEGKIIGMGRNMTEQMKDPTAHAELLAIRQASFAVDNWRLDGAVIYSTLEPCPMCMGAILLSRISRLVFGAYDDRYGVCVSRMNMAECLHDLSGIQVIGGIMKDECAALLTDFFAKRR